MNKPRAKLWTIANDQQLRGMMARCRDGARAHLVDTAPDYSKTEDEARKRWAPHAKEILDDPAGAALFFPPGKVNGNRPRIVSVTTSIDTYDGAQCWHLSMGLIEGPPPRIQRVQDDLVGRICRAFFPESAGPFKEGPPEGVYKDIRHFRAPWRPD